MKEVYITKIAKFLPNEPVDNDTIEEKLGFINDKPSRGKNIVLRNNKIKTRYYAIGKNGEITHNNAQLTKKAIEGLYDEDFTSKDIELLSCGTSTPDQLFPSHAAMVHGELQNRNLELNSVSGVCCAGMNALKYGYLSMRTGQVANAVCTGSERVSSWIKSDAYEEEIAHLLKLESNPILALNKDFLRWMLSDGAGAILLQDKPRADISFKIEWMEGFSYAFEMETCMYAGGNKREDGSLKPWSEYSTEDWINHSVFAVKQDTKLLGEHVLTKAAHSLQKTYQKHNLDPKQVNYFLPHISSYYFKQGFYDEIKKAGFEIPFDKWFLNLEKVGNVGAASIYLMLEELMYTKKLQKGEKILLFVPESARFSYTYAYLTVC